METHINELLERYRALREQHNADPSNEMASNDPGYEEAMARSQDLYRQIKAVIRKAVDIPCRTRDDAATMLRLALEDGNLTPALIHDDPGGYTSPEVVQLLQKVLCWLDARP